MAEYNYLLAEKINLLFKGRTFFNLFTGIVQEICEHTTYYDFFLGSNLLHCMTMGHYKAYN